MSENRETARPAPRYWEKAEATKTSGAGTLPAAALPAPPAPALLLGLRDGWDSPLVTPVLSPALRLLQTLPPRFRCSAPGAEGSRPGYLPRRRSRLAKSRSARRKSTRRKAGQLTSQK